MFRLNVAWRLIGKCVQSYHFLDTRRNGYIVDSNFCSEIQRPSMAHIFDSHSNSHLQYKILQNYTWNDINCFLASSKGHHQLHSCLRRGIFIRTDNGVRQPTHGNTNLYYLLLFQSWQKQLPIRSQQKQLGCQRQHFKISQKKGTWYRSCDRCIGCGVGGALSKQVE